MDRNPLQEQQAGNVPIGGVRIGKLPADIAGADGAQDRIADGVDQDVRVGMAQESPLEGDPLPAQDELSARHKTVAVITETDSHRTLLKSFTEGDPGPILEKTDFSVSSVRLSRLFRRKAADDESPQEQDLPGSSL